MSLPYTQDPNPPVEPTHAGQTPAVTTPLAGTLPNLALAFTIIPAAWWLLAWLSSSLGETNSRAAAALDTVVLGGGTFAFGFWIAGLVLAHVSFGRSRRTRLTVVNRRKVVAALVIAYAQVPLILISLLALIAGALVFGWLLFGIAGLG